MKKPTYFHLLNQIRELEDRAHKVRYQMTNNPAYLFVKAVDDKAGLDFFITDDELCRALAEELLERDEPMSHQDIKEVFEFSGWSYTEEHILMAQPDSQKTIDEQIKYYRE